MIKSTNNGSDCWQGDKGFVKHIVCLTIKWYCHLDLESSEIKKYVFVHRNDVTGATETCFLIENLTTWLYWEELSTKMFQVKQIHLSEVSNFVWCFKVRQHLRTLGVTLKQESYPITDMRFINDITFNIFFWMVNRTSLWENRWQAHFHISITDVATFAIYNFYFNIECQLEV